MDFGKDEDCIYTRVEKDKTKSGSYYPPVTLLDVE